MKHSCEVIYRNGQRRTFTAKSLGKIRKRAKKWGDVDGMKVRRL